MHHQSAIPAFFLLVLLSGPAAAIDLPFFGDKHPEFKLKSESQQDLADTIAEDLETYRGQNPAYEFYETPQQYMDAEREFILKYLRSQGYYEGSVEPELQNPNSDDRRLLYTIEPGPLYRIRKLELTSPESIKVPSLSDLRLKKGDGLVADRILNAKNEIEAFVSSQNCLYEVNVDYEASIYPPDQLAFITFRVKDSPQVKVGTVDMQGLEEVDPSFLREDLPLVSGECFNRSKLNEARLELLRTNLIARVDQNLTLNRSAGTVDVMLDLQERSHRTIKAGGGYTSDEGVGVSLGWEHRNFFGAGQLLQTELTLTEVTQALTSKLTLPKFYARNQKLEISASASQRDLEAFRSKSVETSAIVTRQITENRAASAGPRFRLSEIDDEGETEQYVLLSFPTSLRLDTTSQILDPRDGATLNLGVEPFMDLKDTDTRFIKSNISATTYFTAESWSLKPTLALKAGVGSISGANIDSVPADERYYVGGGGSVRGYKFQTLGELDEEGDPVGGLSFIEMATEGRFHIGENLGFVLFLDGGLAMPESAPRFDQNLKYGAGFGLRYYTSFAPFRVDFGFPLSRRDGIDDSFQLYISIGEAY
ncbi:autotransporter assembly complex protein TamA [Allohahella marinimesophila]|uniref:Autotransporter assembly complex family protein n=1 Tax=Allohahella marinimesophila TaxID=1054972 RepID=A0ABP7Q5C3_9GAMM